ncbi:MAG: hypothetical protein ACE367_17530 [Acidimicrobiales bacterium]
MKITEAQRLALRTHLVDVIGEPDTDVLMASIPPIDYELLATKDDVAALERITTAEFRSMRSEIQALRSETTGQFAVVEGEFAAVRSEIQALRSETTGQFAVVEGEFAAVRGEMVALRSETTGQFATIHGEFAAVRGEMVAMEGRFQLALAKQLRVMLAAQFASVVATVGLVVGLG